MQLCCTCNLDDMFLERQQTNMMKAIKSKNNNKGFYHGRISAIAMSVRQDSPGKNESIPVEKLFLLRRLFSNPRGTACCFFLSRCLLIKCLWFNSNDQFFYIFQFQCG